MHWKTSTDLQIGSTNTIGTTSASTKTSIYRMTDNSFSTSFVSSTTTFKSFNLQSWPLSFSLDSERIVEDSFQGSAEKITYLQNAIKLCGIDFRGVVINKTVALDIPTLNLESSQYESDLYTSKTLISNISIVNFTSKRFTIIVHHSGDVQSRNKVLLRHFVIERNRFFPDSDWIGSFDFNYGLNIQNLYLRSVENIDRDALILFTDPISLGIRKAIIDDANSLQANTSELIGFNNSTIDSKFSVLTLNRVVEGFIAALIYDSTNDLYWSLLFDPKGKLIKVSNSFSFTQFDRRKDFVSDVTLTPFGYFICTYVTITDELKYIQFGWDGNQYGSLQIIGKNNIEALNTSPDSFIEQQILHTIEKNSRPLLIAIIEDQKSSGTNGGTFTSGAWRTRDLNTIVANDKSIVSLFANQFTLKPGTYKINATAPAFNVNFNQIRLYNITDSVNVKLGSSFDCNGASSISTLACKFTITETKTFEIQHQCSTTFAVSGFGRAASIDTEIYTRVEIQGTLT